MKRFLKINAADNVAVALADDLHEGETLDVEGVAVTLREDVARGHKFALRDIAAGENVVKYGYPIVTPRRTCRRAGGFTRTT